MTKILLLLLFVPAIGFGQDLNSTRQGGKRNIYNDAVRRLVRLISAGDQSFTSIYIQEDGSVTDSLSDIMGKTNVEVLNIDDINRKVETETSFILYKVYPLSMDNGKFFVNVVPFSVSRDKGKLAFKNAGTFRISYSYDCAKRRLRYSELVAIDY